MPRAPSAVGWRKTSCTGVKSLILKFPTAVIWLRYARVAGAHQVVAVRGAMKQQATHVRPMCLPLAFDSGMRRRRLPQQPGQCPAQQGHAGQPQQQRGPGAQQ